MRSGIIREVLLDASADDDLSEVLDFGAPAHILWVYSPTLTSATVDIQGAVSAADSPASTAYETITSDIHGGAGTGDALALLRENEVTGFRHYKIATSAGQGADRTFVVGAVLL